MKNWKDAELDLGNITLFVSQKHIHYPGEWYFSCTQLRIEQTLGKIEKLTEEQAKQNALDLAKTKILKMLKSLEDFNRQ